MTRRTAATVCCIAAALALGGCSSEEPPPVSSTPEPQITSVQSTTSIPTPTQEADAGCPNEAAAASNRGLQRGPSLRADVDGDALADEIYVALDPASGPPCAAFVVVVTASGPISEPVWEMGSQAGLPEPRLHGTVDINGDGVPEILVDEAVGASTQFVGALIATDGDLRRVEPGGNGDGATDGLFAYGGSVGHLEGVGCASEDRVVMSVATPGTSQQDVADGVYDVHRRFYELDGSTLKLDTTEEKHLPADRLDTELPEFATGPFGNC